MKKMYKINQFTQEQFDQFEEYGWCDDEIVIIEKKDAWCMDITANGKRIVPILRKIEKSMTDAGLAGDDGIFAGWFGEWANELTDRRDRKYFIWNYSGKSDRERGCWSYSWGIEQIDEDLWYIFLNIAKPQEDTPSDNIDEYIEEPTENDITTEEQTTIDTTTDEEQNMNTNTKKISFEIRQIDALNYGDEGWIFNTSYQMGEMQTMAKDEKKAFTAWMKRHLGISFKPNRTLIEYDGDCYTIIDRRTKEPLFIAIPNC